MSTELGAESFSRYTFDQSSRDVIATAQKSAVTGHIGTEHLLKGLLEVPSIRTIVSHLQIDPDVLQTDTAQYIKEDPNDPETVGGLTPTTLETLDLAEAERVKKGSNEITPEDLFVSILEGTVGMAFLLLRQGKEKKTGIKFSDEKEERKIQKATLLQEVRDFLASEEKPKETA